MIDSIREKIEIYLDYNEPLMMFNWYRKRKFDWEKENIRQDYKKLIKFKKQKRKKKLEVANLNRKRKEWKRRVENDTI